MMQTVTEIAAGRGEDGCSYCCHIALDTVGNCVCAWMLNHMLNNTYLWLRWKGLRCICLTKNHAAD